MKREIKEELGINVEILNTLNVRHFTRDDGQIVTLLIFLSNTNADEVILSEEHSDFDWIPIHKCKDKLNEFFHEEIDIFNKLNQTEIRQFTATKAFIVHDGKILLLKESEKYEDGTNIGKWDVPGGRIKAGQRFDESLLREIKEETGLNVKIGKPFHIDEWRPVVREEQWQIIGTFIECFADSFDVKLSEDHDEFIWINPEDYMNYSLAGNLSEGFENYLKK